MNPKPGDEKTWMSWVQWLMTTGAWPATFEDDNWVLLLPDVSWCPRHLRYMLKPDAETRPNEDEKGKGKGKGFFAKGKGKGKGKDKGFVSKDRVKGWGTRAYPGGGGGASSHSWRPGGYPGGGGGASSSHSWWTPWGDGGGNWGVYDRPHYVPTPAGPCEAKPPPPKKPRC